MLKIAKAIGLNSDQRAVLAMVRLEEGAGLFGLLYLEGDDAFTQARLALSSAEESFFSSDQSVPDKLLGVFHQIKEAIEKNYRWQLLIAATTQSLSFPTQPVALYLVYQGEALRALVFRDKEWNDLLKVAPQQQLISGFLQVGDRVIFTTDSLLKILGDRVEELGSWPIDNLEDEVGSRLPEAEVEPVGVAVLEYPVEEKQVPEDSPERISVGDRKRVPLMTRALFGIRQVIGEVSPVIVHLSRRLLSSKKILLAVVGMAVLGSILGGWWWVSWQRQLTQQRQVGEFIKKADDDYSKAVAVKDSNPKEARSNLETAKTALEQALKLKPQDQKALSLKKQLEENSPSILRVFPVGDFPLWLDLDLIKKGFITSRLSLSVGKLLLLDGGKKTLVEVDIKSKSNQLLAGPDKIGDGRYASLNGSLAWVFSEDKGIVKVDTGSKAAALVVAKDLEWGKVVDLYGFANNIYLLDQAKNQIWKYVPIVAGYSDKAPYFKSSTKVDLATVKRLQIDSSVWILKEEGEVIKYTQGAVDYFSFEGLDKPLGKITALFVSSETESLYLLDPDHNRLVVVDKKGVYLSQYQSAKFREFVDLAVDEAGKKVYFLDGTKIYDMDL